MSQSLDFGNKNSPEEQCDTLSIRSDASSDSENFFIVSKQSIKSPLALSE